MYELGRRSDGALSRTAGGSYSGQGELNERVRQMSVESVGKGDSGRWKIWGSQTNGLFEAGIQRFLQVRHGASQSA
jgi:hypothetical protein